MENEPTFSYIESPENAYPLPDRPAAGSPGPKKRRFRWARLLGLLSISLLACILTYSYAEYASVRNAVLIGGGSANHDLFDLNNSNSSVDWARFQKPGDGRFNILLLGIGGVNDQGQAHSGTDLTDSIQVLSIDTINKKSSLTSIPRDFYYDIPGHGPNKINAVYEYALQDHPGDEAAAAKQVKATFGKVLGVNISNFAILDFTAAKEAVDAVGGLDIDVPAALYDSAFPCPDEINFCPFSISAGLHHMDGDLALKYMRTRHADNDFGRSKRQQQVLSALKKKALSLGILSNPAKVNDLLGILSRHVKTDLQPDEITALLGIASHSTDSTSSNVLDTSAQLGLLVSQNNPYAGYVETPVGGPAAFGPIHVWFQKNNPDPLIAKEAARIVVARGDSASQSRFDAFVENLKTYGFSVEVSPASGQEAAFYVKNAPDKPVTSAYLKSLLGSSPRSTSPLDSGADIEIVYNGSAITY